MTAERDDGGGRSSDMALCLYTQTQDVPTKTIGVREEVYERLKARKRDGESFTELLDRLIDDTTPDWREGFGTLPEAETAELETAAAAAREQTSESFADRHETAVQTIQEDREDGDETP